MKIDEINRKIHELEVSIELLEAIRREYVADNRDDIAIKALNDGIKYTRKRLDEYKTSNWVMTNE